MITLEGHLDRITYYNDDNHYTIARLKPANTGNQVTIVGFMAGVSPGQTLKVSGSWETHRKYGQQFKIDSFEITLPATVDGIEEYLKSGVIKGIGPLMASRLVGYFGAKTLDVIEKEPEKLTEVSGIGKGKSSLIRNAWQEHHAVRTLMNFLQDHGVKASYSARIYMEYGTDAIHIIQNDPYRLTEDIPGAKFKIADTIAKKMDIPKDDPRRIRACVSYVLHQNTEDGHVFSYENEVVRSCNSLIGIGPDNIRMALHDLSEERKIVIEEASPDDESSPVYLQSLHAAEKGIANRIRALMSVPVDLPDLDSDAISREVLKKLAIQLSSEQLEVLEKVLSYRAVIITGGPGTGKTTLIRSINALFTAIGKQIAMAAPTGRAARRLSEVTKREAKTIHRLLGYNFKGNQFEKNEDNPLDADAVVIDEASMVDTFVMWHLLKAVPVTSVLILVGDIFQLPSVGPGSVLEDMIKSESIPAFYLTKIFRQAQESPIIVNAHKVRQGEFPDFQKFDETSELSEFYFLEQGTPEAAVNTIVRLCSERIPESFGLDPMKDIQVLTPMHKGDVGTINLNQVLQKALNATPVLMEHMGNAYRSGDKVMHLRNNYQKEVFNGDIGTILSVDKEDRQIAVDYYGRAVNYEFEEMNEISLAYAITVHKSQGSEYPAVVVPIMTQHYVLLQRNLLYTALTRGKRLVVLVGTRKALGIALNNDNPGKRLTKLAGRIKDCI